MSCEEYFHPGTVEEAMVYLREKAGNARIIAGGTDLVLQLREHKVDADALVDLSAVEQLSTITESDGWIMVGSMVTHNNLASSAIIQDKARVLADAARSIGSPQIRNIGTIGGNVVNAQPAADTTIALMALDARVRILTNQGEIIKPVDQLFVSAGKSAVDPTSEILVGFEFKASGWGEAAAFMRHAKRKALALPIVNAGVWVKANNNLNAFEDVRIALGPMAPVPVRAKNMENALKGMRFKLSVIKETLSVLEKEINPRDSIRGSAHYKGEMAKVLVTRALIKAITELGGELNE
ncbi:FAD binding domain-containing protein [Desulfoscipio sp. XC116]|uniref:FAD binding domain-containing protein n=1 Tax=Desulfoscipio sp. XC116 TaxID=3144975 RepID=UPI00325B6A90